MNGMNRGMDACLGVGWCHVPHMRNGGTGTDKKAARRDADAMLGSFPYPCWHTPTPDKQQQPNHTHTRRARQRPSFPAVPRPPHPTPTSRAHTPARPTPADAENGNPPGGGGQHPRKAWPPLHHAPCPPAGGLPCPPTQALRFTFSADAEFSSF